VTEPDLRTCAYYRGVGTCSFHCHGLDGPQCLGLGPPDRHALELWDRLGLPVDPRTRRVADGTALNWRGDEPIPPHPFEPSYTGMVCERMVMRDGGGDQCGLPADHPIHREATP
jgi:hypothetical protein